MSLTREEWEKMWNSAKSIEHAVGFLKSPPVKQTILYEIRKIKEQIQQVVGQME